MAETEFPWTQDTWDVAGESRERRVSTRNERLAWFGVIALAVLAFEVTADPALTVAVGCLKFGWDEFRLARWLRKTDPDRRRGRVCSRFYLAWGLWRVSLVASAMMFIVIFAHAAIEGNPGQGGRPGVPPREFISSFLLALSGFLFSSTVSTFAVISALQNGVRVWVGPEVRWALEENAWPPQSVPRRRVTTNRTKAILLSALITIFMLGFLFVVLTITAAMRGQAGSSVVLVGILMTLMIGGPILLLLLVESLARRMIALTPEACWTVPPIEGTR